MSTSSIKTSSGATRITGLGSGLDIDSMVKASMTSAQSVYDKMKQNETKLEWKKAAYNTMYKDVFAFQSTLSDFGKSSSLLPQTVSSSNTSAVTATANSDAGNVTHTIKVAQLADGVKKASSAAISVNKTSLMTQLGITDASTFTMSLTCNGTTKQITVDPSKDISTLVSNINAAGIGVTANYDSSTDKFSLSTTATGGISFSGTSDAGKTFLSTNLKLGTLTDGNSSYSSSAAITAASDKTSLATQFGLTGSSFAISLTNNGTTKSITVKASESIYDLVSDINSAGVQVSASYDTNLDRFFLYTTNTGKTSGISFSGSSTDGLSFLQDKLHLNTTAATGQNAEFSLDGIGTGTLGDSSNLQQSTNSFTISGVTYNLASTGSANIAVSTDVDKIVSNVQSFIDSYNTLLSTIKSTVSDKPDSDYQPLTDDQKSSMSETDISLWTDKAKVGLLHNDRTMQALTSSLTTAVVKAVSGLTGKYTSLSSIGISTSSDLTEKGKLHVDTDTLKTALSADPTIVKKIFGSAINSSSSQHGVLTDLYSATTLAVKNITKIAGTSADTTIDSTSDLAVQIATATDKLNLQADKMSKLETQYYNKYNAMDKAIGQMQSQMSYVSSMLG